MRRSCRVKAPEDTAACRLGPSESAVMDAEAVCTVYSTVIESSSSRCCPCPCCCCRRRREACTVTPCTWRVDVSPSTDATVVRSALSNLSLAAVQALVPQSNVDLYVV